MTTPESSPLMTDQDTHVFYVQTESRKLRNVSMITNAERDLRPCHWYGGEGVYIEENDFYVSKRPHTHWETQQVIPAGSYFRLAKVKSPNFEAALFSDEKFLSFAKSSSGKQVIMETLDPAGERLQFRFWSHDESARTSFEKIYNDLTILAIAATGL